MFYVSKAELSSSAKYIKKELESQNPDTKLSHNLLLNKITQCIGYDNYQHYLKNNKQQHIEYNSTLSFLYKLDSEIKKSLKDYGIVSIIPFINNEINNLIGNFNNNTYNYTISQYIQMYPYLIKKPFLYKHVKTFKDAFDVVEIFVFDVLKRYERQNIHHMRDQRVLLNSKLKKGFLELNAYQRKLLNNEHITVCDDLLFRLTTLEPNSKEFDNIISEIKKEIFKNRRKLKDKQMYNVSSIENINEFYLKNFEKNERDYLKEISKNIKQDSFFIGSQNEKNNKILSLHKKDIKKLYLSHDDILEGISFEGIIGSGVSFNLIFLALQLNIQNKGFFFIDCYDDNIYSLNSFISMTNKYSKLIYLTYDEFLKLSEEQIQSLNDKNRMVYIRFPNIMKSTNDVLLKSVTKLKFFLNSITQSKNESFILINSIDILEGYDDIYIKNKAKYRKNNVHIIPVIRGFKECRDDFFDHIKYRIIMNNEQIFGNQLPYHHNTSEKYMISLFRTLNPGEFYLLENGIIQNKMESYQMVYYQEPLMLNKMLQIDENSY